jgi:hypothetical protein
LTSRIGIRKAGAGDEVRAPARVILSPRAPADLVVGARGFEPLTSSASRKACATL